MKTVYKMPFAEVISVDAELDTLTVSGNGDGFVEDLSNLGA